MREKVEKDNLIHEDNKMSCVNLLPLYEGNFIICVIHNSVWDKN
jgi:hypothetical protein